MIIYVDVIFLENLILDFIILLATSIIVNNKLKIKRLILGSIVGGIYTIYTLISNDNLFLKIISSLIIVFISFGYKNKKYFLKTLGVFYLTSITFGGGSFMFMFLVNPQKINYSSGIFKGIYPIEMTILRCNFRLFVNNRCSKITKKEVFKNM